MACTDAVYPRRQFGRMLMHSAEIVALIMRKPRTPRELAVALAIGKPVSEGAIDNVRKHLSALHNFGVVRVAGKRRAGKRMAFVFEMQPSPFATEDDMLTELR